MDRQLKDALLYSKQSCDVLTFLGKLKHLQALHVNESVRAWNVSNMLMTAVTLLRGLYFLVVDSFCGRLMYGGKNTARKFSQMIVDNGLFEDVPRSPPLYIDFEPFLAGRECSPRLYDS